MLQCFQKKKRPTIPFNTNVSDPTVKGLLKMDLEEPVKLEVGVL